MIQPTRKAIQIARKIAGALHVEPDDRKILDIAAALEAYAIERIAQRDPTYDQLRAERDAALARAQTAEDVGARYTSSAALQNAVVDRLAVAEERVRMLETAAKAALDEAWGFAGYTCSEFCVHSEDRKESCPMNSQALKTLEAALTKVR